MAIKTIPLSRLETELKKTLNDCADSGETVVVEMPDQRLLAIRLLAPAEDDTLMDELLASNPKFRALVAKSKASPRKPFVVEEVAITDNNQSVDNLVAPPESPRPIPGRGKGTLIIHAEDDEHLDGFEE